MGVDRKEVEEYRDRFLNVLEEKTKTLKTPSAKSIIWATLVELKINTSKKPSKNFLKKNEKIKLKNGSLIVSNKGKKIRIEYLAKNRTSCFFDIRITKTKIISSEKLSCNPLTRR
jgi:aspartate/methionine/tyrosine aminotransferase